GLCASQAGTINRSTDGGATWVLGPASIPYPVLGVWGRPGSPEFWAIAGTNVYYSSNSGTSWSTLPRYGYVGTRQMNHISMETSLLRPSGWVVGDNGAIVRFATVVQDVDGESEMRPKRFELQQNYPNPFNPTTEIEYSLPSVSSNQAKGRDGVGSHVTLKVYDLLGREVATLVNEEKPLGTYTATFEASNLASGVYFYRLSVPTSRDGQAGSFIDVKKLILLK
ncbi:MAG: T9SS type A sorting domain-containing protein, partial [Bacteroidota bacterium]